MERRGSTSFSALMMAAVMLTASALSTPQAAAKSDVAKERQTRAVEVAFSHGYSTGSIVIVNSERKLYFVLGNGRARRYGIAVGSEFEIWTGRTFVSSKKEDPWWYPVDGMDPVQGGDPANPLGKRALYLDWSLLRIHGTPSRGSIGSAVSNGCIRMLNEDVMDLYERVHLGAPVIAIASLRDAGKFAEAKFTGKIQEFVSEDAGSGVWSSRDDGWGRSNRSRSSGERWSSWGRDWTDSDRGYRRRRSQEW